MQNNRRNLVIIFFTMGMVMMGFGACGSAMGLLVTTYAIMQFIFSPIWGGVSDRIGRKPVLMIGVFGNAIAQLLFGFSIELWMLIATRVLAGILSSVTFPAAMAYIGYSKSERDHGGGMGTTGVAMGVGMVLGPGTAGWSAWVPRMEKYHGVVSLDHTIKGHLHIDHEEIDYNSGRGNIEKDWGASFPTAYIWFQSNHFEQLNTSLTASGAITPWLRNAVRPKGGVLLGPDRVENGEADQ
jgi:hypothetical protein